MHTEVVGEFSKHFLRFMRVLTVQTPEIWSQVSDTIEAYLKLNNKNRLSKRFTNEANFIRRVTSASKQLLYCQISEVLKRLILLGDINIHIELLLLHSGYLKHLISPSITRFQLKTLDKPLFEIRRRGLDLYKNEGWITINSHLVRHFPLNIERFGSSRNTWVYAFESQMGILKRWIMQHRNSKSEGVTMMNYVWRLVFTTLINDERRREVV